jgi:hypothetical protein
MVNLSNLKVSLTKHGAHKVAELLFAYPPDELLSHVDDKLLNIHIDEAQARINLSIGSSSGKIPDYWDDAKKLGQKYVRGLVLLSIAFSHHRLIEALRDSRPRLCTGIVRRGTVLQGKEYTNFACIFEELGFIRNHRQDLFEYDFSELLTLNGFPDLFVQMLRDKLVKAGMSRTGDALTESLHQELHLVLGMNASELSEWWNTSQLSTASLQHDLVADFPEFDKSAELKFKSGHLTRSTTPIRVSTRPGSFTIDQLHNRIQNALYEKLRTEYGHRSVGTERPIGQARVDVVLKSSTGHVFYEIKTTCSARSCIRQGLAQLLEYAYWPDTTRAVKIVVVGTRPLTNAGKRYMKQIRKRFYIPVWYQFYDRKTDHFSEEE